MNDQMSMSFILNFVRYTSLYFQTEIGYARAWVRLALERKSLSEYLRVLVSDAGLLKGMYKRYGFLR